MEFPLTSSQGVFAEALQEYGLLSVLDPRVESLELSRRLCYELSWSTLGVNHILISDSLLAHLHVIADLQSLVKLNRFV